MSRRPNQDFWAHAYSLWGSIEVLSGCWTGCFPHYDTIPFRDGGSLCKGRYVHASSSAISSAFLETVAELPG